MLYLHHIFRANRLNIMGDWRLLFAGYINTCCSSMAGSQANRIVPRGRHRCGKAIRHASFSAIDRQKAQRIAVPFVDVPFISSLPPMTSRFAHSHLRRWTYKIARGGEPRKGERDYLMRRSSVS